MKTLSLEKVLTALKKKRMVKIRNEHVLVLMNYKKESDVVGNGTLGKLDYLKRNGFRVEMLENTIANSERFKEFK